MNPSGRFLSVFAGVIVCGMLLFGITEPESAAHAVWRITHSARLATRLAPNDAGLQFEIGNHYFGEGDYDVDRALAYYHEARRLDPTLPGLHYQMARIYFVQGAFYQAEREINTEIESHPDYMRSYYVRGLIYGFGKRYDEAVADFQKFIAWNPETWAGYNDLAWIYFEKGDFAKVRDTARAGLANRPDNPWLLNSLGVALLNLNDSKGARDAFSRAFALLDSMGPEEWGRAYPGNDPSQYEEAFLSMKAFIQQNLDLLQGVDSSPAGSRGVLHSTVSTVHEKAPG